MLGIWHRGDWLKRDLDSPIYGRVERGNTIFGLFIAFINEKSIPLISHVYVYVDFMVDMFMIFLSLLCWLYVCFMEATMYGSQHVFNCK